MNYATIKKNDVANGEGVRVSLFVSGCRHHCKNCFNKEAWDFGYGAPYTEKIESEILAALKPRFVSGLSLLGGEPFEPENQADVLSLVKRVKAEMPEKTVWCYTGFLYENIRDGKVGDPVVANELLSYIDVLVDGKFVEELKSLMLKFKGSSNQRTILVKETLEKNEIVLWDK